jgi:hypothetical protein
LTTLSRKPSNSERGPKVTSSEPLPSRDAVNEHTESWRKSTFSWGTGECVEVANLKGQGIGVRDSQNHQGPVLRLTGQQWSEFLAGLCEDSSA